MCKKDRQIDEVKSMANKTIYLAGGCFWGVEQYLKSLPGVAYTQVGYANGKTENPSYEDVCYKGTGHAEAVRVEYDPAIITLAHILHMFFDIIDPTSLNRQGNDMGPQYRSAVYYVDQEDEPIIRAAIARLQKKYDRPIAIQVGPLENYCAAEDYHQDYLMKNPAGYCHIGPDAFEKAAKALVDPSEYSPPDETKLKNRLTPLQYKVVREDGTEPPYQNEFHDHYEAGIYVDIATGEPLFSSSDKFEACGWPSFSKPIDPSVVRSSLDLTHGMTRDEVRSRVGDSHLGHVFGDGQEETGGLRYCINSAALRFIPKAKMKEEGYEKYIILTE
jgi:peptide methionine sulfoxide reductase msrA/msrB